MTYARLGLRLFALAAAVALGAYVLAVATGAQSPSPRTLRPEVRRALRARTADASTLDQASRPHGRAPLRRKTSLPSRPRASRDAATRGADVAGRNATTRELGRPHAVRADARGKVSARPGVAPSPGGDQSGDAPSLITTPVPPGTSMSIVLHTSQLSTISAAGTNEQYADLNGNLAADARATFDAGGGSFDSAVGRSGTRYHVYSAVDDRGTFTTGDDRPVGVLVTGRDANGDFVRDSSQTFDLERDFDLPSAVSVVAGTSRAGREFVVVSSSGYFNHANPNDPDNEPTAGVVLLVRSASGGGFDPALSRALVAVGNNALNNANSLALLPNGDLLVADFDSNELRAVRDTNADGVPDTLDANPYYSFQFSNDSPLEVAANSRGVVFTHSAGAGVVMLALYDTNVNGYADAEEVVVEGLSVDDNLIFHGLTVDREGTVYVVEDALGAADPDAPGAAGGTPSIDAFPDPALNGFLRDGALYAAADNPTSQALSGLAFGFDPSLPNVATLALTNSASLHGAATRDGLATITGAGLTRGRAGLNEREAELNRVVVTVEGRRARVLSFDDSRVHIYVPGAAGAGVRSVVVWVDGYVAAAEDVSVAEANPGLFTLNQSGTSGAIALLASGMRYTAGELPVRFDGAPSTVALFGTGWRNSLPVTATVGGRAAAVEFAGATEFPGLDQINVRLPGGTAAGTLAVVVTTANGATSRAGVTVTVK
ncbi:MAG: hypothetical protein LC800_04490 [Acidobacteria bacterium]|nr:hypothetical protein [Acidobacteriota bacterium]